MSRFLSLLVLSICALLLPQMAYGQITGDLVIEVTDASGAAMPNAKITVKNMETGALRELSADNSGAARASLLSIGSYEVKAEASGFSPTITQAVVNSGAVNTVRLTLSVEATRQEVVVEENVVSINTVTSQLQTSSTSKMVTELPLNATGVLGLAGTTPGVIPVTPRNPFLGLGSYNSNGGRGRANNITIDSAVATDVSTTGGAGLGTVPEFMIREVNVISNNFSAEFGRNASSQFQILTKSGSNEFHGQGWWFLRNDKLNSRDYFDRTGRTPPLRDNRWGGYFSAPIVKNRLFAIGHYEQQTIRGQGGTRIATTWTPAQVASITNPTSRQLFEQLGGPRFTSPSGTTSSTAPLATDTLATSVRADWNINDRQTLFGRWAWQDVESQSPGLTFIASNLPTNGASSVNRPQNATISYTNTLTPTMVWNALAAFGRSRPGFSPLETFGGPSIGFQDGTAAMGIWNGIPQGRVQNVYQYLNTVTISKGAHTMKGGYEFSRTQANSYFDANVRGTWTFASFAAFANGTPALYSQRFGNSVRGNRVSNQSIFFQDDWRVRRDLTVNLGMRLEIAGGVTEVNNLVSNLNLRGTGALGGAGTGPLGDITVGGKIFDNNYNWGPRFGFAWNPGGGKTSIRGGYGMAYDFIFLNPVTNLRFAPPFMYQLSTTNFTGADSYASIVAGQSAFQQLGSSTVGGFGTTIRNFGAFSPVDYALRNPQTQQWSLTLERDMFGMLWRAGYVGTKTNFLQRGRPINTINPANAFTPPTTLAEEQALIASGRLATINAGLNAGPTASSNRIDPRFLGITLVDSSANSNYHGVQLYVARRFKQGLGFTASYTGGKSIDDVSDVLGVLEVDTPAQQNPFNNRDNRGLSAFDITHRFVFTHNWELPFFKNSGNGFLRYTLGGWSLNGIFQTQTGFPLPLFSGVRNTAPQFPDPLFLGGGGALRPNLVGQSINLTLAPEPGGGASNPNKVTNSGLEQPLLGNFGTLGRNVLRQNGLTQYDLNLQKDIPITEKFRTQLQAQMFNLFNNTSFSRPGTSLRAPANFGYYQDTNTNTRNITLTLRLIF
jgi:hypothetical protein